MDTFLQVIGFLLILAAIIIPFFKGFDGIPKFIENWKTKTSLKFAGIGILIFVLASSFFFARESKLYYILNKANGKRTVATVPGLVPIVPFVTEVQEWDKYLEIKGVKTDEKGDLKVTREEKQALKDVEGIIAGGVGVRFIDKVTADVFPSVRFQLPTDPESFIKIVETYRTPENLVMNTLVPTVSEQLKNITFMFTADEYVSGGATIYRSEIEDVLKGGAYVFVKSEVRDTIFAEPTLMYNDTSTVLANERQIREIKVLEKNEKMLQNGIPIRKAHEITENNIITAQVIIDDIILNESYEEKLNIQRDLSAQTTIENQKIITARSAQQRIIAEGERDKALERVKEEKSQVSRLIAIETQVKEEESKRQLAEINVETEKLKSEAKKIAADAEAYQNAKLVQAGLTPKEKAEYKLKEKDVVSKNLAGMQTPKVVITGGDGKSNSTEALLQVKLVEDILKD